jgi:hypothetical protein
MLAADIEWLLMITGLATAGAVIVFLAPVTSMKLLYGQAPSDALSLGIVRHWGLLICLIGALLIYASDHAGIRVPTLIIAIVEKTVFALGTFISPFHRRPTVFIMALADTSMAVVYLIYLAELCYRP